MVLMDYFPFLLYFLLSYSKDTSQNIAGCWVWNMVSGFGNSSPKGGTGWWLDWLAKATEHCGSSQNGITEVPEGSSRFENVCRHFIVKPKRSLGFLDDPLIWLGWYILYCIDMKPHLPNKIILSTYLDICLILKSRIPFGTQMFYLHTIRILHTDSLCNIHNPYNLSWLLCTPLD